MRQSSSSLSPLLSPSTHPAIESTQHRCRLASQKLRYADSIAQSAQLMIERSERLLAKHGKTVPYKSR